MKPVHGATNGVGRPPASLLCPYLPICPCCFCSVAKSCPTLCNLVGLSTPDSSGLHYLPEFAPIHVIESVLLSNHLILCFTSHPHFTSPFTFNLFQDQALFQWVGSSHQVASASSLVLPMNTQGWFLLGFTGLIPFAVQRTLKESSPAPPFKSINFLALSPLYGPTLISVHDYWKNHSFCWQSDVSAF